LIIIKLQAPEVVSARHNKPYSLAADVFSFGMVLYNMMTLHRPYETIPQVYEVHSAIKKGVLPYFPATLREMYRGIVPLYESCISQIASKRPSFAQLVKQLSDLVNQPAMPSSSSDVEASQPTAAAVVDINAISDKGWTALHTAANDGDLEVCGSACASHHRDSSTSVVSVMSERLLLIVCAKHTHTHMRSEWRSCFRTMLFKSTYRTMKEQQRCTISCVAGVMRCMSDAKVSLRACSKEVLLASPHRQSNLHMHNIGRWSQPCADVCCCCNCCVVAGADVNVTSKNQETPLLRACTRKRLGAVKALIRSSANVNVAAQYVPGHSNREIWHFFLADTPIWLL
jgi:ankyrin repeat protein